MNNPYKLRHRAFKWWYLTSLLSPFALAMIAVSVRGAGATMGPLFLLIMLGGAIATCAWVYETWRMMPERDRGKTSPGAAVVLAFVPFLNIWWMFAMNRRIAKALERVLAKQQSFTRAPTILAWLVPLSTCAMGLLVALSVGPMNASIAASAGAPATPHPPSMVTMLLPFVVFAPFLYFAWMFRVDRCFEEIKTRSTAQRSQRQLVE